MECGGGMKRTKPKACPFDEPPPDEQPLGRNGNGSHETQRITHPDHPHRQPAPARWSRRHAGRRVSGREGGRERAGRLCRPSRPRQTPCRPRPGRGLTSSTAGEQPRISFSTYVTQRMSGFGGGWTRRGTPRPERVSLHRRAPAWCSLMRDVPMCVSPAVLRPGWTPPSRNATTC